MDPPASLSVRGGGKIVTTEVLLDRARVVPFVRELVAGRVPEHVRMDREGEFREFAGARN